MTHAILITTNVDIVDISGHRSQKVSQVTVKWQQRQQAGLRQAHQFADKGWLYQIHFATMYLIFILEPWKMIIRFFNNTLTIEFVWSSDG